MTDTGEILHAAHQRADDLIDASDKAELGRALIYCGASILGQAEGARSLADTLFAMSRSAFDAIAEGEASR